MVLPGPVTCLGATSRVCVFFGVDAGIHYSLIYLHDDQTADCTLPRAACVTPWVLSLTFLAE